MAAETKRPGGRGRWLVGISLFCLVPVLILGCWPRHDHLDPFRALGPGEVVLPPDFSEPPDTGGLPFPLFWSYHHMAFSQECDVVRRVMQKERALHPEGILFVDIRRPDLQTHLQEPEQRERTIRKSADPPLPACYCVVIVEREPSWPDRVRLFLNERFDW
jgi:hypothetical protein